MKLPRVLLVEACQELVARSKTGSWQNGLPTCFHEITQLCNVDETDLNWVLIVEGIVNRDALETIVNLTERRASEIVDLLDE